MNVLAVLAVLADKPLTDNDSIACVRGCAKRGCPCVGVGVVKRKVKACQNVV